MAEPSALTRLLAQVGGRGDGWQEVLELVHGELRQLAAAHMAKERPGHVLQATALVHEAWLRLAGDAKPDFATRRHFFAAAARAMERVLVDHARRALAGKRGGGHARVTLTGADLAADTDPARALELADALATLEGEDERAAAMARLRLYTGLEVAEAAETLGVSERTAAREWAYARARLTVLLGQGGSGCA